MAGKCLGSSVWESEVTEPEPGLRNDPFFFLCDAFATARLLEEADGDIIGCDCDREPWMSEIESLRVGGVNASCNFASLAERSEPCFLLRANENSPSTPYRYDTEYMLASCGWQ